MRQEHLQQFIAQFQDEVAKSGFAQKFAEQLAHCRNKNYNEEGIPMFLVLEDLSRAPDDSAAHVSSGDPLYNLFLAAALELFREQLTQQQGELRSEDISHMLEVLAEHYFIVAQPDAAS